MDHVALDELEILIIFVGVVLVDVLRQAADDDEAIIVKGHSTGPIEYFGNLVPRHLRQVPRIIDIHPGVGMSLGMVEFAKIDRHIDLAVMVA